MTEYKTLTAWDFRKMTPEQRFLAKIREQENGCWLWTGNLSRPCMYGQMYVDGKNVWAHRFSYEYYKGPIQKGLVVMHSCDNPSCVNPAHLSVGTHAENMADMRRKGRANNHGQLGPAKPRRVGYVRPPKNPKWLPKTHFVPAGKLLTVCGRDPNGLPMAKEGERAQCKYCSYTTKHKGGAALTEFQQTKVKEE